MGLQKNSDVFKFVAHEVYSSGRCRLKTGEREIADLLSEDFGGEVRGWKQNFQEDYWIGKRGNILGSKHVKKGNQVYLINVSPYASIGNVILTVASCDKKAVENFLEDFKDIVRKKEILQDDAVVQTPIL